MAFLGRNSKDKRYPEIEAVAKEIKSKHSKLGAIGFCWGAWAVFRLAGKDKNLLDSVSVAHPSLLEESDISGLAVPVQFIVPETDPMFTPELKEYTLKTVPGLGVDFNYDYYPGLVHGFATRGDQSDAKQKAGLERAKNSAVWWFKQYLH